VTEPVGPQYGLEPRIVREETLPPIDSRDLVSDTDYRTGSEFGGVGGLIQPAPHTPSASERLHMIYAIDPMDDGTRDDSVVPPELDGNFAPR
jgi:hypothetical protein